MEEEHHKEVQKLHKQDQDAGGDAEDPDEDEEVDNDSEASAPSDKMVDRMISKA